MNDGFQGYGMTMEDHKTTELCEALQGKQAENRRSLALIGIRPLWLVRSCGGARALAWRGFRILIRVVDGRWLMSIIVWNLKDQMEAEDPISAIIGYMKSYLL